MVAWRPTFLHAVQNWLLHQTFWAAVCEGVTGKKGAHSVSIAVLYQGDYATLHC